MAAPSLHVSDLACRRGGRLLFEGLTFACQAGDLLHITGPNGVGKSSLFRLIAGVLAPASGTVTLLNNQAPVAAHEALYLFEDHPALKPSESLEQGLLIWARIMGLNPNRDAVMDAAAQLGMDPLLPLEARSFSTGQRKRAHLARLFLGDRPIWLLDEPMNGLDAGSRQRVHQMVADHRASGGLVLVACHDTVFDDARTLDLADVAPQMSGRAGAYDQPGDSAWL